MPMIDRQSKSDLNTTVAQSTALDFFRIPFTSSLWAWIGRQNISRLTVANMKVLDNLIFSSLEQPFGQWIYNILK